MGAGLEIHKGIDKGDLSFKVLVSLSFLELDPVVATLAPTLYSCCFLYWDAVGYVTKPVHCLTLSRGWRADSDFGQ